MKGLPSPVTIVDSVVQGAIAVTELPLRVAENVASVATRFAGGLKGNAEDFRRRMPGDLTAIPDLPIKTVGLTVNSAIGLFEGVMNGVTSTVNDVRSQIRRVTG